MGRRNFKNNTSFLSPPLQVLSPQPAMSSMPGKLHAGKPPLHSLQPGMEPFGPVSGARGRHRFGLLHSRATRGGGKNLFRINAP